ncbi:hypothetical protein ACQEUU_29605 [Nonomuraea sp. CA-218870]|uniref:hypothetical protein n=1 Tax=Nonomuraea sp. CA-218870 TaxID=3239998 RepID=UPI003D91DDC0
MISSFEVSVAVELEFCGVTEDTLITARIIDPGKLSRPLAGSMMCKAIRVAMCAGPHQGLGTALKRRM